MKALIKADLLVLQLKRVHQKLDIYCIHVHLRTITKNR